jgi:cytochrome P450
MKIVEIDIFEDLPTDASRPPHEDDEGLHVYGYQDVSLVHREGTQEFIPWDEAKAGSNPVFLGPWSQGGTIQEDTRSLLQWAMPASVMGSMEPTAREAARTVFDEIVADGGNQFEIYTQVAIPVPTVVTCALFDIDPEVAAELQRWMDEFNATASHGEIDPQFDLRACLEDLARERRDLVATRGARPNNPFDALCQAWIDGATIDGRPLDAQVVGYLTYVLYAGSVDTTSAAIAIMEVLISHFNVRTLLHDDPQLLRGAVSEVVRIYPPYEKKTVCALEEMHLPDSGVTVAPGQLLVPHFASANHDPRYFPEPDTFNPRRPANPHHLGFGLAHHYCLGAQLASLMMRVTHEEIDRRFGPDITWAPERGFDYTPGLVRVFRTVFSV